MEQRPTYNPIIAEEILMRMSEGESLRKICADPKHPEYPCRRSVIRWNVRDTDGFAARYAAARRAGVESRIEDANEIAAEVPTYIDEKGAVRVDAAGIARNRLRVDTAKWEASHLLRGFSKPGAPLDYGDKIQQELSGPDGGAIQSEHRIIFVDPPKAP